MKSPMCQTPSASRFDTTSAIPIVSPASSTKRMSQTRS